jgi:DUF1680 family protein
MLAFSPPHFGQKVANATMFTDVALMNASACAGRCLAAGDSCIAFTWHPGPEGRGGGTCVGSHWSSRYATDAAAPAAAYYARLRRVNTSRVQPSVEYALRAPTAGVALHSGPLKDAFDANVQYLLQMPADDMLYWFRFRSGERAPPGQNWGWDNGGPDKPMGLRGSVAGAFLMGAGGAVRWHPDLGTGAELRSRIHRVVEGIKLASDSDGYIMAFPKNESNYHENPNYVTSWLTHGLLEAAISGETDALHLLRDHMNWFNSAENLPLFLPPALPAGTGPFFDSNGNSVRGSVQFDHGHTIYLIYQGIIHNSRVALSAVGQQQDVDTIANQYQEDWWLRELAARNLSAVWLRAYYPHNYEITALEAYMDMYQLTGDGKYLAAVDGFHEMFSSHWIHTGGTVAIKEWKLYPPDSYFLDTWGNTAHLNSPHCNLDPTNLPDKRCPLPINDSAPCKGGCTHSTGETCGQVFWIKLLQRLHQLRPQNESFVAQMEQTLFNGVCSQIPPVNGTGVHRSDPRAGRGGNWSKIDGTVVGIRQFAVLHRQKMRLNNISTCCEGQATRMLGSIPEYIVSYGNNPQPHSRQQSAAVVYVDMYADATASLAPILTGNGSSFGAALRIRTSWPYSSNVSVQVISQQAIDTDANPPTAAQPINLTVMVRIPSWVSTATVAVALTPSADAAMSSAYDKERPQQIKWAGARGSYLQISRSWVYGDALNFALPMHLRATRYRGLTAIAGHERFAVEFGPILLCAVGGVWNHSIDSMLIRNVRSPERPETWLRAEESSSMRFRVVGNPDILFVPYFVVQEETFEVYPAFEPTLTNDIPEE